MEEPQPFLTMSDEVLEMEVRALSAKAAAAMCWFLLAVAEYDRRRAFEAWECHDMAAWLVWRCGICPVTARQYVRVARSLGELPVVRERFSQGRLSYSQVRAITRAATPDNEEMLVSLAEVSTAAQLEKITRAYRRSTEVAAEDEDSRNRRRYLRWHYDDDGNLVGTFCLPPETGAVLAAAVDARVDAARVADADGERSLDPYSAVRADVLAELVAAGAVADDDDRSAPSYAVNIIVSEERLAATREDVDSNCHLEDGPELADETVRRIACDAPAVRIVETGDGRVLDVGRSTRRISRRMRRALARRDQGCRFPGCNRKGVQGHHIRHWADGGPTRLDNLVSLCGRHHRRVHEAGYQLSLRSDGTIHVVSPDGRTLPPAATPVDTAAAITTWSEPHPYQDGWDGTRLDLGLTIECLLQQPAA